MNARDDQRQALRVKRFVMGAATYGGCYALLLLCWWLDVLDLRILRDLGIWVLLVNSGFYLVFRTGANLRFRDPSLTAIQMVVSMGVITYLVYFAHSISSLWLLFYPIPFIFGAMRLDTRDLLKIAFYAAIMYASAILLLHHRQPALVNLRVETLQGFILVPELVWFCVMGGYLNRQRVRRRQIEDELRRHRDHLAELVREQTASALRARDEAEAANRAKSEFLANMSHELRTPMHAILSFAKLGIDRTRAARPEKSGHYFERIQTSGRRMMALVNTLLDLAKLESGAIELRPAPTDLRAMFIDALAELEPLWNARALAVTIDDPAEPAVCECDRDALAKVVQNLLSNAIKFSPEGGRISVEFSDDHLARTEEHGTHLIEALRVDVVDEGVGIPAGEHELVFQKFAQSSKTRSGAGGTGLGLAIAREIVHAHQGTIRASDNAGPGTCISLVLPRRQPGDGEWAAEARPHPTVADRADPVALQAEVRVP